MLAAFPLIAVHLSRTPGAAAGVGLAATLPQFLVALPAGLVTDRAERRRTMAGAVTLAAAALATLAA
ncbi:MAG: MFS transporter, partial [Acidimicrobiales bacterium]